MNERMTLTVIALAAASIFGCMGGDGTPPEYTPPQVVETTPTNGAVGIPVIAPLIVSFSGELDPSTVIPENFRVTEHGRTVGVNVGYYTEDDTVWIRPVHAFHANTAYQLEIRDVADYRGVVMEDPVTVGFHTWVNPLLERQYYDANGQMYAYEAHTWQPDGTEPEIDIFTGPGNNGTWGDGDDVLSGIEERFYDADANHVESHVFGGPGPDGQWRTADDAMLHVVRYERDAFGNAVEFFLYDGPGPDGTWLTADDRISQYAIGEYDAGYRLTGAHSFADPGPDGVWLTGDEPIDFYRTLEYDEYGRVTVDASYNDPGTDGVWHTADDQVWNEYNRFEYAGFERSYTLSAPGADGRWVTGDDVVGHYADTTFNGDWQPDRIEEFGDPGPDGYWPTNDDVTSALTTWTYAADGMRDDMQKVQGAGADGIWGTNDDVIERFDLYERGF